MHPVSRATHIVSNSLGVSFGRAEQMARILIHHHVLPMTQRREIPNIDGGQLLAIVVAVLQADRIIDAPSVAQAFAELPEASDGLAGAPTLGEFFAALMVDRRRDDVAIDLIRVVDFQQRTQYMALVTINDTMTLAFGKPAPTYYAREIAHRISAPAFARLRRDFNDDSETLAREFAVR